MIFLIFAFSTFLWGVGSLFLVASKTNSVKTVLLRKPSIIIGDFFILPTIAGIIGNYFQRKPPEELFGNFSPLIILLVSFMLTLISALRNKLTKPVWIPHLSFYWFMSFIVLAYLSSLELTITWWIVLIGIIIHQMLGLLFPKKFSAIKNENRHSGAKR